MADKRRLTPEQEQHFQDQGYVVVPQLLSGEEVARYKARARAIACGDHPPEAARRLVRDVRVAKGLVDVGTDPEAGLWKLLNPDRFDPCFRDFLTMPALLDVLEDIVGPDILAFLLMVIYKPPGLSDAKHPFHQDAFYFPFAPHDLCVGAWLPLDDAHAENGSLTVVPRSHRGAVEPHRVPRGIQNFGNFEIAGADEPPAARTLTVPAGDLVLFHARLWHKTDGNKTTGHRRVITVHAASARCQATGPIPHSEFGMRLVRGRLHADGLTPCADGTAIAFRGDRASLVDERSLHK